MEQKNFSTTINLPKTSFSMKANLPQKEPEYLAQWEKDGLYPSIRKNSQGKPKYVLHDGPPYANGDIHIGHVMNKVLKDVIVKLKTMQGFDALYVPGWDCHGMPIEHQLLKNLGITKHEIEPEKFRKKAAQFALKYVDIQKKQFKRLGIFGEWDNPYLTLTKDYEASIVEAFGKLLESGHIYRGLKPINWCAPCETALAEAEVEYNDHTSPSVFVRFKFTDANVAKSFTDEKLDAYLLIWTTTPWTLVSNVACALNPEAEYVFVKVKNEKDGEFILVFAKALSEKVLDKLALADSAQVIGTVKGKDLELKELQHPFIDRKGKAVLADYVSLEDGTGCVHIAPGHGAEDYQVGLKYKLDIIMPVDDKGAFTEDIDLVGGMNIFKANKVIIEKLTETGDLMHSQEIVHSYPHCWRCKKPLIFRATRQWFINVDHNGLRDKALQEIDKVKWVPSMGCNRIYEMVKQRPDWCLSRQRFWGVPIPILYCKDCGSECRDNAVISKIADKFRQEGSDVWFTKTPEELVGDIKCDKCSGTEFEKETDILDVWFDSGVSNYAVLKNNPSLDFPADLYLEGSDQHRGWFQSSLLASVGTTGISPFKAVLTHGFVMDSEGKKMSKSSGNVVNPLDVLKKYGADILRLWVVSCDYHFDVRISDEILQRTSEGYRKFRNTAKYLLGNLCDFNPAKDKVKYEDMREIDKWALSKTANLINDVTAKFESFEFHSAFRRLYEFCVVDMSSFYLDVLKDNLYVSGASSLERRSAQTALYEILVALCKMLAPLMPFTSDEIWKLLNDDDKEASVHLAKWPVAETNWQNSELENTWEKLLKVREFMLKELENKRATGVIGNPLEAEVKLYVQDEGWYDFLQKYADSLNMIFIVSKVTVEKVDALKGTEGDFAADVVKSEAGKCARCWNYLESVGRDSEYPELCHRCLTVVKEYCHIQ